MHYIVIGTSNNMSNFLGKKRKKVGSDFPRNGSATLVKGVSVSLLASHERCGGEEKVVRKDLLKKMGLI